jgi:hypothetical protein
MTRAIRSLLVTATLVVILLTGAVVAQAASAPSGVQPGANCGNTSSAINQYCEDIPSASGGGTPPPGAPGSPAPHLGTTLPQPAARVFNHLSVVKRKRAEKLLSLPTPAASVPVTGSLEARTGEWSPPIGVILAMVATAAVGLVAAIIGRRRRGSGPPTVA